MNQSSMPSREEPELPVSAQVPRLQQAGQRSHANDNISAFRAPGELTALLDEVAGKMASVLDSLAIDTANDHNTQDTARRGAKMYLTEVFRGRYVAEPTVTEFPDAERPNELIVVGPITVRSACSHRFSRIVGRLTPADDVAVHVRRPAPAVGP